MLHAPLSKKASLETAKSAVLPMASSGRDDIATPGPSLYVAWIGTRLFGFMYSPETKGGVAATTSSGGDRDVPAKVRSDVGIYIVQDLFFYISLIMDSSSKVEKFNLIQNQLRGMPCS
ncbi:hypothetical protein L484_020124 [Morus notabilis]|uniref:Uncharacterized protein n=1 Tax=Morus notabilis TaxID=981085 RepID=W9RLT4_9ROSA|nr:hypothetical protein L484_020124 [Morus notabilis]